MRKTDIHVISIFQFQKILLQARFWVAAAHANVVEFQNFLLRLKDDKYKSVSGFAITWILRRKFFLNKKVNFKAGPSPSKEKIIYFNNSPSKMIKIAFYFILKAIFALKIFKCLSWLFGHVKNSLIRKIRLILKFMTSEPG